MGRIVTGNGMISASGVQLQRQWHDGGGRWEKWPGVVAWRGCIHTDMATRQQLHINHQDVVRNILERLKRLVMCSFDAWQTHNFKTSTVGLVGHSHSAAVPFV